MYKNLGDFISALRKADEIIEISHRVDPLLEIAEITDRVSKQEDGGKALLFTDTGTRFPVITNMVGSHRRISIALGVEGPSELAGRIEDIFHRMSSPSRSFYDKLKLLPLLGRMSRWMPVHKGGRGACQQVVMKDPSLSELPILKCWEHDGGRFITLPMVHTVDPDTGVRNVGMYRMQVFSDTTAGMHWHRHKTGARHYARYKELERRMPVTVCLGGDPVYTYAAMSPLPDGVDEYLLAGFIRKRPVELVRCLTNELEVPSDCDFVIEGYVETSEDMVVEGPFGDHTGFYSLEDLYPLFHVTCITHRRNAVYPATIVGVPPQEDYYMAAATERIFLAPIRLMMHPEITDMYIPAEGTVHNITVVNISKSYPGQAFKVAGSMWGSGQMMFNKFIIIASDGEDIRDMASLMHLADEISIPEDVLFSKGPLDILDHTSDMQGYGGKMCIDATRKLPEECLVCGPDVELSIPLKWEKSQGIAEIESLYAADWRTLFVAVEESEGNCVSVVEELLKKNSAQGVKFILVFDAHIPLSDPSMLVWLAAANCDAVRDVHISGRKLVFDARSKAARIRSFGRRWPEAVASSRETIAKIDALWMDLGFSEFIGSPSEKIFPIVKSEGASVPED